jgi:hypothetical protein
MIAGLISLAAQPVTARASQIVDVYIAEGDSITAPGGDWPTYPVLYEKNATPPVKLFNIARNSQDSSAWRGRSPPPEYYKGNGRNFMSLLPGNDIAWKYGNSGGTRESYLKILADYLDAKRAVGIKVVLCATLPRTQPDFNTERALCNKVMASWIGTHCDYYCDFADSMMGVDRAAFNPRLYVDGTHPTAFGQTFLEEIIRSILNEVT